MSRNPRVLLAGPSYDALERHGNFLKVDAVYGNDTLANQNSAVYPYKTIEAALAVATSGKTVFVYPGTYTLASGITLPSGIALRGSSVQTTKIQMIGVTANTTLVTMGENTRLEDITLLLQSDEHHTLKGLVFPGTTTVTAKLRTAVVTVDNSGALFSDATGSTVIGVEASGTGTLGTDTFSFNCIKGCTINVLSNGHGTKRGILVSNTNIMTTRDTNVYVKAPASSSSTGSYVGVETNDAGNTGSIQLRATTVGAPVVGAGSFTASDILQTTPATVSDPTYLASPGIQIGPGTDLVTKSAGTKGFSTYVYPTTIFYGLKGDISGGSNGYLWPGTQAVSNAFPDATAAPYPYYRVQQPLILSGISAALNIAPGTGQTLTLTVRKTTAAGVGPTDTAYTITFNATDLAKTFYNASVQFAVGDKLHVYLAYTGGNQDAAHDLSLQLDLF
jgi:Protein of unknown function (DUF1565)